MVLLHNHSYLEDSDIEVTRKQNFSRQYSLLILTYACCSPYYHHS